MIHIVSIVVFFALFALAAYGNNDNKTNKIITGIMLFLILLGGFGLKARLGVQGWPLWISVKMVVWLFVGGLGHMVVKRCPQHAIKAFWFSVGLLTLASYLANFKTA